jgi:hypothetical protein
VDLTGRVARLLDVVEGRSGEALCDWVSGRMQPWRDAIGVAALDPFRRYASALSTSVPAAIRVLDAFHVSRLGFAAVDDVEGVVSSRSPPDTAAANTTRCSASGGCCAAAPTACPSPPGSGC